MDFVIILFLFLFPLAALGVSLYSLYHILSLKKAAARISAFTRLAGEDPRHE